MSSFAEQFDNILLSVAQQHTQRGAGIEGLLDTFFGFLQRKTDFFYGADEGKAEEIVMKAVAKQVDRARHVRKERMEARAKAQKKQEAQTRREEERRRKAAEASKNRREAQKKAKQQKVQETDGPEISIIEEGEDEKDKGTKSTEEQNDEGSDDDSDEDSGPAPVGNGGSTDAYRWTQTLQEVSIFVAVPEGIRGKHCVVDYNSKRIKIGLKNEDPIIDGEFFGMIDPDECTWTLEDTDEGREISLYLVKHNRMEWWKSVVKGGPEIDTKKIVPENSKLADLDGETRQTVEKMMFDQRQKAMGKPTSDEMKKQEMMEKFMKQHPEMDFSKAKFS